MCKHGSFDRGPHGTAISVLAQTLAFHFQQKAIFPGDRRDFCVWKKTREHNHTAIEASPGFCLTSKKFKMKIVSRGRRKQALASKLAATSPSWLPLDFISESCTSRPASSLNRLQCDSDAFTVQFGCRHEKVVREHHIRLVGFE